MSFGFEGEEYVAISIETRKEKNEEYSTIKGFFKQYELIYIVGDERDLVRLRTNYRGEEVYLYRLSGPREVGREVFLQYLARYQRVVRTSGLVQRLNRELHDEHLSARPTPCRAVVVELEAICQRLPG